MHTRMRPGALTLAAALGPLLWSGEAGAAPVPDRLWGSYVAGYSPIVRIDGAGNVYIAGGTTQGTGVATPGAHKAQPESFDVSLVKLDPAGERIWGTYFGGPSDEGAEGLAVGDGGVVICGATNSSTGIASPGSFQAQIGEAATVGFVASFSTDGAWTWGTYLSGTWVGVDGECGVVRGPAGSVYSTGTISGGDIGLGTPGAHMTVPANTRDAFLIRLGTKGELLWGTYYGGDGHDYGRAVARDGLGGIYLVGSTGSVADIATPGAHQVVHGGGNSDAFVARFTEGGVLDWGTYVGGAQPDDGWEIAAHPAGGVVMTGEFRSTGLSTPGAHQELKNQAPQNTYPTDVLLARFDAAGARLWSTYFGGEADDSGRALAIDGVGGIYVGGSTKSSAGVATNNAYKTTLDSQMAGMFAKFDDAGALQWATYYLSGGCCSPQERVRAFAPWGDERVLVSGWTGAPSGATTPDAYLLDMPSGIHAGFVAAFSEGVAACTGPRDCVSGFCVDGVCCDAACGGGADDCQACSAAAGAAVDGHCGPSAPGKTCRAGKGFCDPKETCTDASRTCPDDQLAPDGTLCPFGACMAGSCVPEGEATTGEVTTSETTGEIGEETDGGSTGGVSGESTSGASTSGESTSGGSPSGESTASGDPGTATSTGAASAETNEPTTRTSSDEGTPTTSATGSNEAGSSGEPASDGDGDGCGCTTRTRTPGLIAALVFFAGRRRRAWRAFVAHPTVA